MSRILILADIRPMGYGFYAVVVFVLGKDFLFKSSLGRCGLPYISKVILSPKSNGGR